jgi:hypothetical protein
LDLPGRRRARVSGLIAAVALAALLWSACGITGGEEGPDATATPALPGPEDAIAGWVAENRSLSYIGDCSNADRGADTGKLCSSQLGERGRRRAYALGPTFSDPTALAIVEDGPQGWTIYSVENNDQSGDDIPGIDWPMEPGDRVIVIGLGEGDCLSVREQPTQQAMRQICLADGTTGIIQEGPTEAEGFTWWRISGEGFSGWAAGTWLRLEESIRDALQPQASPTAAE